jgi:chemotaxis protein histidine kinase CheA
MATKNRRGLGMSIIKQIVEAHQGEVWAERRPGEGSCFRFRLQYTIYLSVICGGWVRVGGLHIIHQKYFDEIMFTTS